MKCNEDEKIFIQGCTDELSEFLFSICEKEITWNLYYDLNQLPFEKIANSGYLHVLCRL